MGTVLFNTLAFSGADDPDGDGELNALENLNGSNPNDGTHALRLEYGGPNPESGIFLLRNARSGVRYQLQASLDMETWESIAEVLCQEDGSVRLDDPHPSLTGRKFLRVSAVLN